MKRAEMKATGGKERRRGGKPAIEPFGKNGIVEVARRVAREEIYLTLTPLLRRNLTVQMQRTFSSQGQINSWVRYLPRIPRVVDRRRYAPVPVWRRYRGQTPEALRGQPGIKREPEVAEKAFEQQPLHDFFKMHFEALRFLQQYAWNFVPPSLPRMVRSLRHMRETRESTPAPLSKEMSQLQMSHLIRDEAARLGFSTIGFAPHDPKYTYAEYATEQLDNVIVCIVEQDYDASQTAPSGRAERAAFRSYSELLDRLAPLADFIQGQGYRARPQDFVGQAMMIHYGVQAGLGQLGMNGQLLTPQAGSRCRIALITTDAPVEHGEPVDYGIEKLCDACQICVKRCPVGAIPNSRRPHRGVLKAKIKTERCFPTMIQTHGCAVCIKVCPVQRYGLDAVHAHYEETDGEILGKGSDDLEGYHWPLDGRYYTTGHKPRVDSKLIKPDGFYFDKNRQAPPADAKGPFDLPSEN
jgi:epoxyqueuosine reductase